jgi:hypothetical protein
MEVRGQLKIPAALSPGKEHQYPVNRRLEDCPQKCTLEDLWLANKKGFDVAQYWAKNL